MLLKSAIIYAEKFNFSVIPIKPKDKKPLIKWEKFQKVKATRDQLKEWWEKWPDANIGLITGEVSNLAVIDIDTAEGFDAIQDYLPDRLFPVVDTPSGGQHYYFHMPSPSIGNNARTITGCDFRGEAGYVVAPPSVNNNEKSYKWQKDCSIKNIELTLLPDVYVHAINKADRYMPSVKKETGFRKLVFEKGQRDEDLFHVANCLAKGEMHKGNISVVLNMLSSCCIPPFDSAEIKIKIDSALQRIEKKDTQWTEEVSNWVSCITGMFNITECYNELRAISSEDKSAVRVALSRLCDKKAIKRDKKKNGIYHKVDDKLKVIDWEGADEIDMGFELPFELHRDVVLPQKGVVVIAGVSNAGKSGFMLEFSQMNCEKMPITYFASEWSQSALKRKIQDFGMGNELARKIRFIERSDGFADVLDPDGINIIDFLETHEDAWRVSGQIKDIFDKLDNGIALIALQKSPGSMFGKGGHGTIEKACLAITLDDNILHINKLKTPLNPDRNINGLGCRYEFRKGGRLKKTGSWGKIHTKMKNGRPEREIDVQTWANDSIRWDES